jgi:hypothetical protein
MHKYSALVVLLFTLTEAKKSGKVLAQQTDATDAPADATWTPNTAEFDQSRLGTESERFFLRHSTLGHQMDQAMADLKAQSANTEQMQLLRDSLECSENLAKLFPDDVVGNTAEMNKIAGAFLNNAMKEAEASGAKSPVLEELSIINSIINAGNCPSCTTMTGATEAGAGSTPAAPVDEGTGVDAAKYKQEPTDLSVEDKKALNDEFVNDWFAVNALCAAETEVNCPINDGDSIQQFWTATDNHAWFLKLYFTVDLPYSYTQEDPYMGSWEVTTAQVTAYFPDEHHDGTYKAWRDTVKDHKAENKGWTEQ